MLEKNKQISLINNKIFWRKTNKYLLQAMKYFGENQSGIFIENKIFSRKTEKYVAKI